jgi:hypothetical protein
MQPIGVTKLCPSRRLCWCVWVVVAVACVVVVIVVVVRVKMNQKQQSKPSEPSAAKDAPHSQQPAARGDNGQTTKKRHKNQAGEDNQSDEDDRPRTTAQAVVLVAATAPCYITDPGENDILMGRGKAAINYVGNQRYRALVRTRKEDYALSRRTYVKENIAREIFEEISHRGGRFLQLVEEAGAGGTTTAQHPASVAPDPLNKKRKMAKNSKVWMLVDVETAMVKIKQTLRDREYIRPTPATTITIEERMIMEREQPQPSMMAGTSAGRFLSIGDGEEDQPPKKFQRHRQADRTSRPDPTTPTTTAIRIVGGGGDGVGVPPTDAESHSEAAAADGLRRYEQQLLQQCFWQQHLDQTRRETSLRSLQLQAALVLQQQQQQQQQRLPLPSMSEQQSRLLLLATASGFSDGLVAAPAAAAGNNETTPLQLLLQAPPPRPPIPDTSMLLRALQADYPVAAIGRQSFPTNNTSNFRSQPVAEFGPSYVPTTSSPFWSGPPATTAHLFAAPPLSNHHHSLAGALVLSTGLTAADTSTFNSNNNNNNNNNMLND